MINYDYDSLLRFSVYPAALDQLLCLIKRIQLNNGIIILSITLLEPTTFCKREQIPDLESYTPLFKVCVQ